MKVAKFAAVAVIAASVTLLPVKSAAARGIYHSPNAYEDYIIQRESSGRSWVLNPEGCAGLMQACPGHLLANACPNWQYNIDCQLNYFTNYMVHRYGTWYNAYLHSRQTGWW